MPYVYGIICWCLLSAGYGGNPFVGIIVGALTTVVLLQRKKLAELEKRIDAAGERTPVRPPPLVESAAVIAPTREVPRAAPAVEDSAPDSPKQPPQQYVAPAPKIVPQTPEIPAQVSPEDVPRDAFKRSDAARIPLEPKTPAPGIYETIEQILGPTVATFLLRGNPIARIGAVVLFFGVGFFLKYVNDLGFFPIELRLLASALLALALVVFGWRLRSGRKQFSVTLQGAGIGIFYITVFVAFKLYHLLPGPLTFAFLLGVTILAAASAVIQDARSLAFLSVTGGFLAPVLASTGGGSHVMLFSYFAVLNLGVFAMSWYRSWREVNVVGYFFTFAISTAWGAKYYNPAYFPTVEPFLILFVVLYAVMSIFLARPEKGGRSDIFDSVLVFGTPFFGFMLQSHLVYAFDYGMAWSAVGFGAIYIVLASVAFAILGNRIRFLIESFFAIGVLFLTLAVPFAVDGRLTSAVWSLEAVAILWSGVRQKRKLVRFAALALLAFSSAAFLLDSFGVARGGMPFANAWFFGIAILAAAHLSAARILKYADADVLSGWERTAARTSLLGALGWWFLGGIVEIGRHARPLESFAAEHLNLFPYDRGSLFINAHALFFALSSAFAWILGRRIGLSTLVRLKNIISPILLLTLAAIHLAADPLSTFGLFAWPVALITHYAMLRVEDREVAEASGLKLQHAVGLWTAVLFLGSEVYWLLQRSVPESSSWAWSGLGITAALCSVFVTSAVDGTRWPFAGKRELYLEFCLAPVLLWLLCWPFWLDLFHDGSAAPLPYVAFLNPLDISQLGAFGALLYWLRTVSIAPPAWLPPRSQQAVVFGVWIFVWLTVMLLRSIHHYAGVPWDPDVLFDSHLVQASLSVFWSVLALIIMPLGNRRKLRGLWIAGALLLVIIVGKLFLVDLSGRGTLARIIAFLATGLLMLLIGYLAPIPPDKSEGEKTP